MTSPPLRLHIGGHERRAGWTNVNIQPGPHVDVVADARDLSAIATASVAEIYCSHVLEHFSHTLEINTVLKGFHRILAPGGSLRVSVPDFALLCRMFGEPGRGLDERFLIMKMIFGGHLDAWDYHKAGLSEEFLTTYLAQNGFVDIRRVAAFDLFADGSTARIGATPISLNMVAEKPRAAV